MDKIIISPSKYVQGENAINNIGEYVKPLGQKALVIADDFVTGLVGAQVTESFAQAEGQLVLEKFNGECSRPEIERLIAIAEANESQVIIGIGGGKTLDTAKSIAFYRNIPVVVVPTIASTDAPTSALAVIYTPAGEFSEYLMIPRNPNMVIMDSKIIAGAPVRLLVSGMGDALSTYFEARSNARSGG
ncbi:MAG TPA: iron-containing alcohol dehydrogenase, partial [Psychromonas sp.]